MLRRSAPIALSALSATLLWLGAPRAASQSVEKKQTLVIGYPTQGIAISNAAPVYKGTLYVKVYPAGSSGAGTPLVAAELNPSQRTVSQLPYGEYEVHYAMRKGSELTTLIHRNVILRPDQATSMTVEMNADAKTTLIGGDWTVQQTTDAVKSLQQEVAALRRELAELKRK